MIQKITQQSREHGFIIMIREQKLLNKIYKQTQKKIKCPKRYVLMNFKHTEKIFLRKKIMILKQVYLLDVLNFYFLYFF